VSFGGRYRRRDERGRSGDSPVPLSESLEVLSQRMGVAGPDVLGVVFGRWAELVGPSLAAHVRPLRLRERTLVVAADHPAWATQVRHLSADILVRLRDACGAEHAPEHLEVRVRA
jgi:predicted nucleic acid-binding Zn ribbon protein